MKVLFPPSSFFGMPLGILGLGLAWRAAIHLWLLPPIVPEVILSAGCLLTDQQQRFRETVAARSRNDNQAQSTVLVLS